MTDIKYHEFEFNRDNLSKIIDTLKDLSKISPFIKMKLDNDTALFYAIAGKDGKDVNSVIAMKSVSFPIEDFIISDEPFKIDFIILNGPNLVKNLDIYKGKDAEIKGRLAYREKDKIAGMMYVSDGTLNLNFITGDYKQVKDITKLDIENKMNPSLANFSFTMTETQFKEVKKLITLNKAETVNVRVKKGKLEFYDKRWSLYICDLPNVDDESWSFAHKFLKSIDDTDSGEVEIFMFDQFLLFKEGNVALMIGLELSEIK